MDAKKELLVTKDNLVVTLTINRPEKRNTLNPTLLREIADTIPKIIEEDKPRVIVLTSAGEKAFSAGFDIRELSVEKGEDLAAESVRVLESAFSAIRECEVPVIAMINGYVIGAGLDLAVNCDFRICHSEVKLGITPAKLGLVYHYAGIQRFLNLVGLSATKYLFYTGELINTEMAKHIGLADFVVDRGELEEFTYNLAGKIAYESAPISIKRTKSIINSLTTKGTLSKEEEAKALQYMIDAYISKDMIEGQMAFAQKRKPNFTGE